MKYKISNNISVFYANEKESGFFENVVKSVKSGVNKIEEKGNSVLDSTKALNAIAQASLSSKPRVQLAYKILRTTGAITYDPLELKERFEKKDGGAGARAITEALSTADKTGEIHVVVYEQGTYRAVDFRTYEKVIQSTPEKIDHTILDGLVQLYGESQDKNSFTPATWSKVASYMASRNWTVKMNTQSKEFLTRLYQETNKKYTGELNRILEPVLGVIGKQSPELKELLKRNDLLGSNGDIDFNQMILKFNIKNLNDFEPIFRKRAEKLLAESKQLLALGNKQLKDLGVGKMTASELGISPSTMEVQGKPYNFDKKNIDTWDLSQIEVAIPRISGKLEGLKKELLTETDKNKIEVLNRRIVRLQGLLEALAKKKLGYEKGSQGAQASHEASRVKEIVKKNPRITKEEFVAIATNEKSQTERKIVGEVAMARLHRDNLGTVSFEEAQRLYTELEKKGNLTPEEEAKKREYYAIIEANKKVADIYQIARLTFGDREAQEIFIQTNRFISDNPKETYNFQSLEKIAILTDSESTPGQKSLARLEVGQSLPMSQALEGELQTSIVNAPELKNINISKNADGTYNIPMFNEANITKNKLDEYKENTKIYAELGLSQFIPHIPLISAELRSKGINTKMDGNTGTTEQQQVLKVLYSQLFGKQVISSSLGDVERAFSSALGNPTSMKSAMQHTLKIHKLIPDSGRAISADILTTWIRKNKEDNNISDPGKNLTP